jgi:hypothetical protein
MQLDSISEIELPTEFLVARRWQLGRFYKIIVFHFFSFKNYCQPNKFAFKTVWFVRRTKGYFRIFFLFEPHSAL